MTAPGDSDTIAGWMRQVEKRLIGQERHRHASVPVYTGGGGGGLVRPPEYRAVYSSTAQVSPNNGGFVGFTPAPGASWMNYDSGSGFFFFVQAGLFSITITTLATMGAGTIFQLALNPAVGSIPLLSDYRKVSTSNAVLGATLTWTGWVNANDSFLPGIIVEQATTQCRRVVNITRIV